MGDGVSVFFFLLLSIIFCSSLLVYCYLSSPNQTQNKPLVYILWLVIFIATFLICSSRHNVGLIFDPHISNYDFGQTLTSDYLNFFITDILITTMFIAIYFFITRKLKINPMWCLLALIGVVIYLYYPGISSADGIDTSYNQFLAHSYSDFQPPLFTIWWQIFRFQSSAFMVNIVLYYGAIAYISYFLQKRRYLWQNDLLILFCFNPLLFTQLAIVWKDVSFTAFLLDCIALYLLSFELTKRYQLLFCWVLYFTLLFLATGFRLNGIVTVFPLIILGVHSTFGNKLNRTYRIIAIIFISLILSILFFTMNLFIAYKVFEAKRSLVQGDVMLSNIASIECISKHKYKIDINYFSPPEENSRIIFCDQVINYFNNDALFANWSGTNVTIIWPRNESAYQILKKQWFQALVDEPLYFILYRSQYFINVMFYNYWYPTGTLTSKPDLLSEIASRQHQDMKVELAIFLIAGTIALSFGCIYFRIFSLPIIILSSSWLQLITLFITIPNHSARYFFWNYIAVVLIICLINFFNTNKPKPVKIEHKKPQNKKPSQAKINKNVSVGKK